MTTNPWPSGLLDRAAGTPMILDTHVVTDRATASWGNDEPFWPTEAELYRMLAEHGYPCVFAGTPWVTTDRTFFLCLPEAPA